MYKYIWNSKFWLILYLFFGISNNKEIQVLKEQTIICCSPTNNRWSPSYEKIITHWPRGKTKRSDITCLSSRPIKYQHCNVIVETDSGELRMCSYFSDSYSLWWRWFVVPSQINISHSYSKLSCREPRISNFSTTSYKTICLREILIYFHLLACNNNLNPH